MTKTENSLFLLIGETLKFCQCIEFDIKALYAIMAKGDSEENLKNVEDLTLGEALKNLEELDYSDDKPYLSKDDYKYLSKINTKRNHIVHKTFQEYLYYPEPLNYELFEKEFDYVKSFHDELEKLYKLIENIRIEAIDVYKKD